MARPFDPLKPARDLEILHRVMNGEDTSAILKHFAISRSTFKRALASAKAQAEDPPEETLPPLPNSRSAVDLSVGAIIRILRDSTADRTELARLVPMTAHRLAQIEEGRVSMTLFELDKIARVFGLKASEMLDAMDPRLHVIKSTVRAQAQNSLRNKLDDLRTRKNVLEFCKPEEPSQGGENVLAEL